MKNIIELRRCSERVHRNINISKCRKCSFFSRFFFFFFGFFSFTPTDYGCQSMTKKAAFFLSLSVLSRFDSHIREYSKCWCLLRARVFNCRRLHHAFKKKKNEAETFLHTISADFSFRHRSFCFRWTWMERRKSIFFGSSINFLTFHHLHLLCETF